MSAPSHVNNFDFLRLLFSTLVLVTHSYALTGLPSHDGLWLFSTGQAVWSALAVHGFFVISGYLILKSLLRSGSLGEYAFKRMLRLFPALWVVVGVCVVGAFFLSDLSAPTLLHNASARAYLLNLVLRTRYFIDGVFTNNAYPRALNGSLWTVPYEMLGYLLLMPLFFVRFQKAVLRVLLLAAFAGLLALQLTGRTELSLPSLIELESEHVINLGLFFAAGSILALFPALVRHERMRPVLAAVSSVALLVTLYLGGYTQAQYLALPVAVITIGASNWPFLSWIRRYGDISYGVYLWGFPVQQCLWHFLQPSLVEMMVLSIAITWVLGYASWHLLEKHALGLKLRIRPAAAAPSLERPAVLR